MTGDRRTDVGIASAKVGRIHEHGARDARDRVGHGRLRRIEIATDRRFADQATAVTKQLSQAERRGFGEWVLDAERWQGLLWRCVKRQLTLLDKLHHGQGVEELRDRTGSIDG